MTPPATAATPDAEFTAAAGRPAPAPPPPADLELGRATLLHALLLGVAADALLRPQGGGLAWPVWVALFALAVPSLVWRAGRVVPREAAAWLATAVLFASGAAWRDAGQLVAFDVLASLGALAMAALAIGSPGSALFAPRLRDTVWAAAGLAASVAAGAPKIALDEARAAGTRDRATSWVRLAVRLTIIVGPLLLVFGSLLRDADPIFASLVALPDVEVDVAVSHVVVTGAFAWAAAGWARGALVDAAGRRGAPQATPFTIGMLDVTAALGTLVALFGLYVATQLGWFFGGERFLQARTGLTAAAYARGGFFQMVWVVLLVVPVLLATRAMLAPGRALARRHTALALPMLLLLGAMILSAVLRLKLYVHYYGLTTDRLYPLVFMGWLAVVLAWLARTVLRGWDRPFVAGAAISGLATLAALNVVAPDALIARVNLARGAVAPAGAAPRFDLPYLSRLSGEAAPLVVRATLAPPAGVTPAERCEAARRLLARWGPASSAAERRERDAAWRWWNAGEAQALDVVRAQAGPLLAIAHGCPTPPKR